MQRLSFRVAVTISAAAFMLAGWASSGHNAAAVEPEAEAAEAAGSAPEVVMCYLGLEFSSETLGATTVRVDVDGKMMALVGAGDKTVFRYAAGMHDVSVALPNASKKKRKKNMFAVELKPFAYTKIVIEAAEGKKAKKRLIVRVLEDGEEVRTHTIEL